MQDSEHIVCALNSRIVDPVAEVVSFDDYVGQESLKQKLHIYIQAACMRNEPLDHTLLFGPPGLGKTTLCQLIARSMNAQLRITSGPAIVRTGDMVALLSSLEKHDVLFIDEIHRLPLTVEEILYTAMEEFRIDVIVGQGTGAKSVSVPLFPFTLIGATTQSGLVSAPLRSRFAITERIDYYTHPELALIVNKSCARMGIAIDDQGALLVAQVARGTPRIAKKLVRRVRDFAQIAGTGIDASLVKETLKQLGIDELGLTQLDRQLLHIMIDRFNGGPAGVETLASMVCEDAKTILDVYEPYLLRCGYLERTPRGRQIPHKIVPYIKTHLSSVCP